MLLTWSVQKVSRIFNFRGLRVFDFLWRYVGTHMPHLCRQVRPIWTFCYFLTAVLLGRVLARLRFLSFPKNGSKNSYQIFRPNKEYYTQVMRNLRETIRQKRPDLWKNKNWLLHHDNAPAHTSLLVCEFLAKNNTIMLPQPPCSPDLALLWLFLVPETEETHERTTLRYD